MPSGRRQLVTMVLRSEPSGFIEWIRPPLNSRTNNRPERVAPDEALVFATCRAIAFPCVLLLRLWRPCGASRARALFLSLSHRTKRFEGCAYIGHEECGLFPSREVRAFGVVAVMDELYVSSLCPALR